MTHANPILSHVLWIGGSPCSGKSSVAKMLAEAYGFRVYHCDEAFERHILMAHPDRHPTLHGISRMTWEEIWMRPIEELVQDEISAYREQFEMIVSDLQALPKTTPIIAEGAALLPEKVYEYFIRRWHVLYMIPTPQFQWDVYPRRGAWVEEVISQTSDPVRAFQNWMQRDIQFGDWVYKRAVEHDMDIFEVDGSFNLAETTQLLERYFRLLMPPDDAWVDV